MAGRVKVGCGANLIKHSYALNGGAPWDRQLSRSTNLPGAKDGLTLTITMTWHVQYRRDAVDNIVRDPSPELAIEAACRLIDDGWDVYGIGTELLTDSIGRGEIARIYEFWARAKQPLGRIPD
jgi:hypothetical protein